MKSLLKVGTFTLGLVLFYLAFANSIPQIESVPPEEGTAELTAGLGGAELALIGEEIFNTKGGCLTCHGLGAPGPRAPDLAQAAIEAPRRLADPDYGGQATTPADYLVESLLEPRLYAVSGYEPMGANISAILTLAEIKAVAAYLQSLGGEVTLALTEEDVAAASAAAPVLSPVEGQLAPGSTEEQQAPEAVVAAVQKAGCGACHVIAGIAGAAGQVGPDLSDIGTRADRDYIRESLVDPQAAIAEGCPTGPCPDPSVMPAIGTLLSEAEVGLVVDYLSTLTSEQ